MFVDVQHPTAGATRLTGSHIKLSATPPRVQAPAPTLGQHNDEVLGGLPGMTPDRLARLRAEQAI